MRQLTFLGKNKVDWREVAELTIQSEHESIVRPFAAALCDGDSFFLFHYYRKVMPLGVNIHYLDRNKKKAEGKHALWCTTKRRLSNYGRCEWLSLKSSFWHSKLSSRWYGYWGSILRKKAKLSTFVGDVSQKCYATRRHLSFPPRYSSSASANSEQEVSARKNYQPGS